MSVLKKLFGRQAATPRAEACKLPDTNVMRVRAMLLSRMDAGYKKYGTTTDRTDLSLLQWLQHLQEELLDAAVYVERLKEEVRLSGGIET